MRESDLARRQNSSFMEKVFISLSFLLLFCFVHINVSVIFQNNGKRNWKPSWKSTRLSWKRRAMINGRRSARSCSAMNSILSKRWKDYSRPNDTAVDRSRPAIILVDLKIFYGLQWFSHTSLSFLDNLLSIDCMFVNRFKL